MLICSTSRWFDSLKEIQGLLQDAYKTNIDRADLEIKKFADGEILPVFKDTVRDRDLLIIGSTEQPHDNIFEMILIIDAARRASVKKITLVVPYFGYSRQDRRNGERCSHGSKTIANILQNAGADHIITFDVHALQIDGNFDIPFDNITIDRVLGQTVAKKLYDIKDEIVLCSPDAGGIKRVEHINHLLEDKYGIVTILKKRIEANKVDSMQLIGDVKGKFVLICDDILDTGGTLCKAAEYLLAEGAIGVGAAITHGLLSNDATTKIAKSKLSFLILTTSTPGVRSKAYDVLDIQGKYAEINYNNSIMSTEDRAASKAEVNDVDFVKTEMIIANVNGLISNIIYRLNKSMSLESKQAVVTQ